MKKLLFVLLAVGITSLLHAQAYYNSGYKLPLTAGDTAVNTGTSAKVIKISGGFQGIAVQCTLSLLSGTGAGTVGLYGSMDGVNYVQIGSNYTITNTATQSTIFYQAAPLPTYIKVLVTGSGTESIVQTVTYRTPKYQTQ